MQRTSIEGTLIGNARASRTTTAKSLLKIYTTSVGKDIFALQKTSSINHRNSEAKSITKSFHLSKPSIGDIKDTELQRGSVSQASPGKSIGSSGLLSGTDFIQPKHFYLDRQVRVKRKNLPSIKGGMITEQDLSLSRSINHETVSVDPYSAGSLHQSNHDFGKQGEYIRSNPHFNRFHRTLYAIDKIESEKLLLSKETFYYPEQVQMIQSVVKTRTTEENDDNLNLLTRVLKENKKEDIDIPPGKVCYVKIYTHGKVLPLKVDIEVKYGSFEAFVSRRSEKPGFGNNDFYFTSNQFSIDYGEFNDDVSCLYFGIASLEKSKISILCTYIVKTSLKKEESSSPKPKDKSLSPTRPKSKGVYEFVGQNINQEQLKMFEESVSKIKAERKRKNLIMAGGKNWLIENKEIATEYHRLKEVHISTSNKQWELKVQRTKDMKDIVETEKKKKMLLEKLKYELTKMETEMQEKRAKKKREKFRVEASWMAMLVLFRLVKEVNEKKRAMVAVNVLKRIKEMTATQIQKKMRKLLNKKYLVRVFGHKNDTFLESSDLEIRNQINLFKCLNAMALLTKQQKEETAGLVVSYLAQDLIIPMKLTTGLEKYIERVIRVQKQWRTKRIIAAAKVSLFMKVWRQFCQEITDEEAELKKKKYSQTIAQIRDFHIMKHARKFVRDKMRGFLRILHAAAEKEREAKMKAKTTTSIIDIPSKIQDQASARQNVEGVTIENTQRNIEDDGPTFRMHTVFAKPTKDELRVILDKIVDEMKDGKGGIKSFLL